MLELITEYYWLQNLRVTVTLCTIVKLRKDYLIIVILIALKCINTARAIFLCHLEIIVQRIYSGFPRICWICPFCQITYDE